MPQPIAYFCGRYVPANEVLISPWDAGFIHGVTITEQLRTFAGNAFLPGEHLQRLRSGLHVVGVDLNVSDDTLLTALGDVVKHNHALLPAGSDLGVNIFVTPGASGRYTGGNVSGPVLAMVSYPLRFAAWSEAYTRGLQLVVSSVGQPSTAHWPYEIKHRSRIHYYLAEREARERRAGSIPVLLNSEGLITDASIANVVIYRAGQGLCMPKAKGVLPGISACFLKTLARQIGLVWSEEELRPADVALADEVLVTSTPWGVLPAVGWEGKPIGKGEPGPIFSSLLEAWSRSVDVDMLAQALRHSGD